MKRISTLFTAIAAIFTFQVNAQYLENFEENFTDPSNGCTLLQNMMWTTSTIAGKNFVINNTGSAYSEPPVSSADVRMFGTPYLTLSTATTISFDYQMSAKLAGSATRFINVGLIDSLGNFTSLDSFGLNPNVTSKLTYTRNVSFDGTTVQRVAIRLGGGGGDGNSRVSFDDLAVNATPHNGGSCNVPPVAVNDDYYPVLPTDLVTGNVITDARIDGTKDADADGAIVSASLVAVPDAATVGVVTLNADGSFTFTPAVTFLGGPVTFSYRIIDNGYLQGSAIGTVNLNYAMPIILPVKMISFAGSVNNNKAQLKWAVAENETGDRFQVMRSANGKNFTEIGIVFINGKEGAESYTYADANELDAVTYYKLKIVNKNNSVSYSNVIMLKSAASKAGNALTILKNPVEATLSFTYSSATATQSNVVIYNTAGVKVFSTKLNSQKGTNAVTLNLDNHMATGTYFLEVSNTTERAVTKLIKR